MQHDAAGEAAKSGSKVPSRMMAGMYIINESLFTVLCSQLPASREAAKAEVMAEQFCGRTARTSRARGNPKLGLRPLNVF